MRVKSFCHPKNKKSPMAIRPSGGLGFGDMLVTGLTASDAQIILGVEEKRNGFVLKRHESQLSFPA
jgi:hypothetical protein